VAVVSLIVGILLGFAGLTVFNAAKPGPIVDGSYTAMEQELDKSGTGPENQWTQYDRELLAFGSTDNADGITYYVKSTWRSPGDQAVVTVDNVISEIIDTKRHIHCNVGISLEGWELEAAVAFVAMADIQLPKPMPKFEGRYDLETIYVPYPTDTDQTRPMSCWVENS
jgi:hypothetical protein